MDLNHRHQVLETCVLPTELHSYKTKNPEVLLQGLCWRFDIFYETPNEPETLFVLSFAPKKRTIPTQVFFVVHSMFLIESISFLFLIGEIPFDGTNIQLYLNPQHFIFDQTNDTSLPEP